MKIQMTLNGKKITEGDSAGDAPAGFLCVAHGCKSVKRGCETANAGCVQYL